MFGSMIVLWKLTYNSNSINLYSRIKGILKDKITLEGNYFDTADTDYYLVTDLIYNIRLLYNQIFINFFCINKS